MYIILSSRIFKGFSIRARHSVLQKTIGPFPEEEDAYQIASLLMWILPLMATTSACLEIALFFLFNRFGHPWSAILADK